MKKDKIPKALREQIWIHHFGKKFEVKCPIKWCNNMIDVYNHHMGHNIPEAHGGKTDFNNLLPICSRCNNSMSDNYTIDEWNELNDDFKEKKKKKYSKEKKALRKESWSCCGLF